MYGENRKESTNQLSRTSSMIFSHTMLIILLKKLSFGCLLRKMHELNPVMVSSGIFLQIVVHSYSPKHNDSNVRSPFIGISSDTWRNKKHISQLIFHLKDKTILSIFLF